MNKSKCDRCNKKQEIVDICKDCYIEVASGKPKTKRVLRKCAIGYGRECKDEKCISLGHKSYWITKEKDETN